jgi:tRNA (guanine-N7-)-methyltransferase
MPLPHDDAARLPEGDLVDIRSLVLGAWLELEIGPGRGWFLVERAQVESQAGLIGVEIRRKWATTVNARLASRGLSPRARVFAEDARIALRRLVPDAAIRRIFVNFPDPWWKRRHEKRLLMEAGFLGEVARLLDRNGELFVQTDVDRRAREYEQLLRADPRFDPAGDTAQSPYLADNPYLARSPRERRAIADGLPIYRMRWRLR